MRSLIGVVFAFAGFSLILMQQHEFMRVVPDRCTGQCNNKYCKVDIKCRPLNRTSKLNTLHIFFHSGIKLEQPINIHVTSYKRFATQFRPLLVKLNAELCNALLLKTHPLFSLSRGTSGNIGDPCPIFGHRYTNPYIPRYNRFPLVPAGEWKVEIIISKDVNGSTEEIFTLNYFYTVTATTAMEF